MRTRLSEQASELAEAAPQVMLYRLSRMIASGYEPSQKDLLEFYRMYWEKAFAAGESWSRINAELFKFHCKVFDSTASLWLNPWSFSEGWLKATTKYTPIAFERMLRKGIEPIHRTTIENARRIEGENG